MTGCGGSARGETDKRPQGYGPPGTYKYLNSYRAVTDYTSRSSNTGLQASKLLFTGTDLVTWDSVMWNSVMWN